MNESQSLQRNLRDGAIAMITVSDVCKCFKDVRAVDGVTLEIPKGCYMAILGPNGAGKTTLVEMIEGIQKPDRGEIRIMGRTWERDEKYLREIIGVALQETYFLDKITTEETIDLFASFYGRGKEVVPKILDLVRLTEKRRSYVMNLSHGMRQRLGLGIALVNDPEILILDEPTTGLDPNARQEVWDILLDLKSRGTSLVLTTHYMDEAELLCDKIVIMDRGKILAEGTMDELTALFGEKAIEMRKIRERREVSLDDIFISLTGRHLDD